MDPVVASEASVPASILSPAPFTSDPFTAMLLAWGPALVGVVVVGALVVFWRRVGAVKRTAFGEATDRFVRAVDRLEHAESGVRLRSVKALDRIAWDSPPHRDAVLDVLTEHVRARCPVTQRSPGPTARTSWATPSGDRPVSAADVQAALAAMLRWRPALIGEGRAGIELAASDLTGVEFGGRDLARASFDGACLAFAVLSGANLTAASLASTNLRSANLMAAQLVQARLSSANLRSASLVLADLRHADLRGACLEGAQCDGADFSYANLRGAHLEGVVFANDGRDAQGLTVRQLDEAFIDESTVLPSYLQREREFFLRESRQHSTEG